MIKNNKTFQKIKAGNLTANIKKEKIQLQTIDFDIGEQVL